MGSETFKQWWSRVVWERVAYMLPRRLVSWVMIRAIAHATTGQYSNQEVPALKAMDALHRWNKQ